MPRLSNHNYNKYELDESKSCLSDRQFPRKGDLLKVCSCVDESPVLRSQGDSIHGGDEDSDVKGPGVGIILTANVPLVLARREGAHVIASPPSNNLFPEFGQRRSSQEKLGKADIAEVRLSPAPHLVLRLRGGASNHDDDSEFVPIVGVGGISTASPLEIAHTTIPEVSPLPYLRSHHYHT